VAYARLGECRLVTAKEKTPKRARSTGVNLRTKSTRFFGVCLNILFDLLFLCLNGFFV